MPRYCLDTSGVSNPWHALPERVFPTLWVKVRACIENDCFCWNDNIAVELRNFKGAIGDALRNRERFCRYRNGSPNWPYDDYSILLDDWKDKYRQYIREFNKNRKHTIGLADLSIVALAKTLELPVVSMERSNPDNPSMTKLRIPDLCNREDVPHLNFVEFLEAEGVVV